MIEQEASNIDEIAAAFKAASSLRHDPSVITKIVPKLVQQGLNDIACSLVSEFNQSNKDWLPEALALFNTPNLSSTQKREMTDNVLTDLDLSDDKIVENISDCNARIGRYGFSFPQWRFLTQGFLGPSLIERYGFQKLERNTDVRDPALPKSNPDRDKYGIGFVQNTPDWTVEYRRAYILCSHKIEGEEATLVVRNSSYFFGRDRLPGPAYISWKTLSNDELQNLNDADFAENGAFVEWSNAFKTSDISLDNKIGRVQNLLNHLDETDTKLSLWLEHESGKKHLLDFMKHALAKQAEGGKITPPFYLAKIDSHMPPWFPHTSMPVDAALTDRLESGNPIKPSDNPHREKMVLLSGPDGDLPLKPAAKIALDATIKPAI